MRKKLKEPFGKAGLIVGVVALVFAMLGGAYAANGGSGGGKATASAKAKQGKQGKPGKTGPAGPQGPAGPAGAKGDAGAPGGNGTNGTNGAPGAPGKSVTSTPIEAEPGEALCEEEGGAEYLIEGASEGTQICNGHEGSPWTAGGTLPPGSVETGYYYTTGGAKHITTEYKEGEETKMETVTVGHAEAFAPVSFPIPLAEHVKASRAFYGLGTELETQTEFTEHCPGVNWKNPVVKNAGEMCIYNDAFDGSEATFEGLEDTVGSGGGSATSGGLLHFAPKGGSYEEAISGSFAVKGCLVTAGTDPNKCP